MRRAVALLAALCATAEPSAAGADAIAPPCTGAPRPAHAAVDQPLAVRVHYGRDGTDGGWAPPPCLGWQPRPFAVLVGAGGRFREPDGMAAIVARLGAVSGYAGMPYWSASRGTWRPFVTAAHAVNGPDDPTPRADFALDELGTGAAVYFWQEEATPAGELVYRLRIVERSARRLVVEVDNPHPARWLVVPLFGAGEHQARTVIEHDGGDRWRYHALMRSGSGPSLIAASKESSYINRAVAVFRHLAGRPGDARDPVAAEE